MQQDPRTHEQPLGFAGKSLIAMFLFAAGIVVASIVNYIYSIVGQPLIDAMGLLLIVMIAVGVGFLAGQLRKGSK